MCCTERENIKERNDGVKMVKYCRNKVLMIMVAFPLFVFFFVYSPKSHLLCVTTHVFSNHMELCILKRVFSWCEYVNDAAKFTLVYLYYVFKHCDQWNFNVTKHLTSASQQFYEIQSNIFLFRRAHSSFLPPFVPSGRKRCKERLIGE